MDEGGPADETTMSQWGREADPVEDVDDMDEFDAPLAANAENKALHREVKNMERTVLELDTELEATEERIAAMKNHMKNVDAEARTVQEISTAQENEMKTEERQTIIAEAETKQLESWAKSIQAEIEKNVGTQNKLQNQIFQLSQEMDAMREQMQWDEQQLSEWLENARLREEDADVIRKYERADEARIKELQLQIEKLNSDVLQAERLLEKEVTSTQSHRLGLDKVSHLFREGHRERAEVIRQWEGTVKQMETEDTEIESAANKFQDLKAEASKAKLQVAEQQTFLEEQQAANVEAESGVEKAERGILALERARSDAAAQAERFQSELDSLRNVVTRTSLEERSQVKQYEALVAAHGDKVAELDEANAENDKLETQIAAQGKSAMSAEQQAAALESQLDEEEAYTREVQRHVSSVSQQLAKAAQQSHELQSDAAALQSEIDGCAQADKNISSRIAAVERNTVHQGQLLYKQDFQVSVLERKLLKLEGTADDGEAEAEKALQAEVDSLKTVLGEHTETRKLLQSQLRRLEGESRVLTKRKDEQAASYRAQNDKLEEVELYISGTAKEIESVVTAKQNLMVEENLLKLDLRRLRQKLNAKADDVLSLEQRKLELKDAMRERMQEIKVHMELLKVQKHECSKKRSHVAKELTERQARINRLQKRHEIVNGAMKGSGDGGEEKSEAYLMVQAAQEREELQQRGDKLDAMIRKQEKELRMLDNTLQLMNGHNQKYKASLKNAHSESDDVALKEHLEGQLRTAVDKYKHKRRELNISEQEHDSHVQKYGEIQQQSDAAKREVGLLRAEVANVQHELDEQQAKLDRARDQARKIVLSLREEAGDPNTETVAEKDFQLRNTREFTERIMDAIDKIVAEVPDLRPEISLLYSSNGIERAPRRSLGERPGTSRSSASSKVSSRATSRASSRVSSRTAGPSRSASRSRSKPATSNAAAAQRATVVTPRTVDFGISGSGVGRK